MQAVGQQQSKEYRQFAPLPLPARRLQAASLPKEGSKGPSLWDRIAAAANKLVAAKPLSLQSSEQEFHAYARRFEVSKPSTAHLPEIWEAMKTKGKFDPTTLQHPLLTQPPENTVVKAQAGTPEYLKEVSSLWKKVHSSIAKQYEGAAPEHKQNLRYWSMFAQQASTFSGHASTKLLVEKEMKMALDQLQSSPASNLRPLASVADEQKLRQAILDPSHQQALRSLDTGPEQLKSIRREMLKSNYIQMASDFAYAQLASPTSQNVQATTYWHQMSQYAEAAITRAAQRTPLVQENDDAVFAKYATENILLGKANSYLTPIQSERGATAQSQTMRTQATNYLLTSPVVQEARLYKVMQAAQIDNIAKGLESQLPSAPQSHLGVDFSKCPTTARSPVATPPIQGNTMYISSPGVPRQNGPQQG